MVTSSKLYVFLVAKKKFQKRKKKTAFTWDDPLEEALNIIYDFYKKISTLIRVEFFFLMN